MNYGEMLYHKGMRRKEELAKHIEGMQKQREHEISEQYSFRPSICDKSRLIAEYNGRGAACPEQELLKFGDHVKQKIEHLRSE